VANAKAMSKKYGCIIVLKGREDVICSKENCYINKTGNAGMTKGGTGDVLAGLIGGLAAKNDLLFAACAGTYLCGAAGDRLLKKRGYFYNASDLLEEIKFIE
jgi:NAD(P)H-hydrate epimerase